MKNGLVIFAMFLSAFLLKAEDNKQFELRESNWNIGLSSKYSEVNALGAGWLGLFGSYQIGANFELGLRGEALYFDRKLNDIDPLKSYHLQAGHAGFFIDWHPFGKGDIHFSIPLYMGKGEVFYIYDKEFRKDMKWSDEIIDKTTFSIWQLGIEGEARISNNWTLSLNVNYQFTSPIEMIQTNENLFTALQLGIGIKYNFGK